MAELNDTSEKHAQAHAEAHIQAFAPRDRRRLVRTRALIATAVAVAVGGLLIFTPTNTTLATPWWTHPVALAGAVLTGLVGATYFGAPRGAEATVCDLRWPIFGIAGAIFAIDPGGQFLTGLFGLAGAGIARPIIGIAALALLARALRDRVTQERTALAAAEAGRRDPDADPSAGVTCTTCTPLLSASTRLGSSTRQ